METKVKCSIVTYLYTKGRHTWGDEVQKLYEERAVLKEEVKQLKIKLEQNGIAN